VLLEPIAGSYERLVIGVAVVSADGFHLAVCRIGLANVLMDALRLSFLGAPKAIDSLAIVGKCDERPFCGGIL
jgi:hypothetical protein